MHLLESDKFEVHEQNSAEEKVITHRTENKVQDGIEGVVVHGDQIIAASEGEREADSRGDVLR